MDLRDMPLSALTQLTPRFRQANKKLVAEKVESREQYQTCLDLGFDYFQGYYFARPSLISGRKLSPSQLAILDLMTLISSDADNIEIERAVKRDVTLALNLLRLVNTPAVGAVRRIDSLSQAVTILGRRQLQRWLQIMLYAEPGQRGQSASPLLSLATTRGRLVELLAKRIQPGQRGIADVAFTVGIMSLMDVLFGIPMEEILEQIPVNEEVAAALLTRQGFYGTLLRLAETIEQLGDEDDEKDDVTPALHDLQVSANELADIEMTAFAWSDTVVKYAL
jgi:EAL and modified HD-GYP domain-containing signal transduction protein